MLSDRLTAVEAFDDMIRSERLAPAEARHYSGRTAEQLDQLGTLSRWPVKRGREPPPLCRREPEPCPAIAIFQVAETRSRNAVWAFRSIEGSKSLPSARYRRGYWKLHTRTVARHRAARVLCAAHFPRAPPGFCPCVTCRLVGHANQSPSGTPRDAPELRVDARREEFLHLSEQVAAQFHAQVFTERKMLQDFAACRLRRRRLVILSAPIGGRTAS
jgi:hypothetical protein